LYKSIGYYIQSNSLTDEPKKPKNSKKRSIMFALLAFGASFIVGAFYGIIAGGEEMERYDASSESKPTRAEYVSHQVNQGLFGGIAFGVIGLGVNLFWCNLSWAKGTVQN
jgi:hypothetical protein